MDALTPARRFIQRPAGLTVSCVWPSDPTVSNHLTGPQIALSRYPSASAASLVGFGLRHWL